MLGRTITIVSVNWYSSDHLKRLAKNLLIKATAGAPVPQIENGYILSHPCGSLYIEPHGYLEKI